jgi:hypothetical protein
MSPIPVTIAAYLITPKLRSIKQAFYYSHELSGSGTWIGHSGKGLSGLSLLYNVCASAGILKGWGPEPSLD